MDIERFTADQRTLREALRARRRTSDGRGPVASGDGYLSLAAGRTDPPPDGVPIVSERAAPKGLGSAPLASVIVVCWNSAGVLGRCLDQLLAQDHPNYEVIVVDDGSQDNTLEIAEERTARRELTIVRSSSNRGCPHARNLGLRHAGGEIIAFVDADGFAAPNWLRQIVDTFKGDASIGGVASTVFFAGNPLVINGAGGIVNRQGWAADLSMNEPYERAEIGYEALYPMGCGMALRRSAVERVGPFDDRMLNYYDDVDYGVRLWRAGYRVVVAPDAWIDHGFGGAGGEPTAKRLLCERHRMRVVLKHASWPILARWGVREVGAAARAGSPRRALKLRAMAWNARHLPSVLAMRRKLRGAPRVPGRLVDPSWGDGFPAGVPPLLRPRPEHAGAAIDMADPNSEAQLLHGWFPVERVERRSYRWAGVQAAILIRLQVPATRLRLDYSHAPVEIGGVDLCIRSSGSPDPLASVWKTRMPWQYISRSVENHPLSLPAGDYEVVFRAPEAWSDPPRETRSLAFALAGISFAEAYEIPAGGLDMASPTAEEQLVSGWFERESSPTRSYRWAARHAAVLVRLPESASGARLSYRMTPGQAGGVNVSIRPVNSQQTVWSTRIAWHEGDWREDSFSMGLPAGDYVVAFDAEGTWSNEGQRDPALPPENRSLGFALSSMSFVGAA